MYGKKSGKIVQILVFILQHKKPAKQNNISPSFPTISQNDKKANSLKTIKYSYLKRNEA
jgi:hypothetical protein